MRRLGSVLLSLSLVASGSPAFAQVEAQVEAPADADAEAVNQDPDFSDDEEVEAPAVKANADGSIPAWRAAASAEQQAKARALFREGNALVQESLFVQAIEKYEEALSQWDHPGVHYNLALALLNLDQPLRLRHHLLESLKFGADALGKDKARRAEQYISLVEKQLTDLTISVAQQGAKVELDGAFLFTAPGEFHEFVRPGSHTIKVSAPGYETSQKSYALIPGEPTKLQPKLYTPEQWLVHERRWNPWGPIAVTVAGVAILGAGGALFGVGHTKVNTFDNDVKDQCGATGCAVGTIEDKSQAGYTLQVAGVSTMAVGAATLAVGGVLLYMNRSVARRVDPEEQNKQFSLLPYAGPGGYGLVGQGSF